MISFIAAAFAILLATVVAVRDRRSFANRSFIACLTILAAAEVFRGLGLQGMAIYAFSLLPGVCMLFSLSFARQEYRKYLARWKYVLVAFFMMPIATLFLSGPIFKEPSLETTKFIPVGYPGKIFYSFILISAVIILANLESTLRASTGRIRWQIKFIIVGFSCICAAWIYSSSQVLIYSALDTSLSIIHAAALLGSCVLFAWGLIRSSFLNVDVYLSRTVIQYSLTALLASVYLVILGLLVYWIRVSSAQRPLPLDALFVLLALVFLGMLLLSDRLQERIKRFVTRHFKKPLHDYRKAWMELTENTNSLVNVESLCSAIARIISKTFGILSVNIWLFSREKDSLSLAGSTVFTRSQEASLDRSGEAVSQLVRRFEKDKTPIDLNKKMFQWAEDLMQAKREYFAQFKMRYILPLQTGGQLVGILTLNEDRVGKAPLSIEDQDLLKAYAAQIAARVLQLRLSENIRKTQEIEAFQNVSAFFVHDLKNIASRLSLTMQNLPAYFDNPEFRADALRLIRESVSKIDGTISRLSSLREKIELRTAETDLNTLVSSAMDDFERSSRFQLNKDLGLLPKVVLDPEQIQKIVTNLLMNAYDAVKGKGKIRVATSAGDHKVILSVEDNGSGMSRQFTDRMLFRPFTSTKKRGMGIGLFHSKMIVEAHHGRMEVESEEGKGSIFRVILPV
jgi:putative PEP-CTERM system histidine kinase